MAIRHGVFGNQYIVCQSNCPVSTVNIPTIDHNEIPGATGLDIDPALYDTIGRTYRAGVRYNF